MDATESTKKIIIIGGGVAGLSAGIFGQKNGFETVVYEKNAWTGTAEGYMYRCRQENMHDAALGTSINNAYRSEAPLVIVERNAVKG